MVRLASAFGTGPLSGARCYSTLDDATQPALNSGSALEQRVDPPLGVQFLGTDSSQEHDLPLRPW